jgi:hypothetical protein
MNDSLTSIGTELRARETRSPQSSLAHSAAGVLAKTVAMTGCVAAMTFAANPAHAASLVNGNFETGDLTGWTVFTTTNGTNGTNVLNFTSLPTVTLFNTTGSGASNSAQFEVGQVSGAGGAIPAGGGITQNVTLASGNVNLAVDVAAFSSGNNGSGGIFALLFDGATLNTFDTADISFNTTERSTLTASTTVSAGLHSIGIQMTRPYGSGTGNTPYQYVDNFAISGTATNSATVPEPFTAIGSLIGGTTAFRIRKKLKSSHKL